VSCPACRRQARRASCGRARSARGSCRDNADQFCPRAMGTLPFDFLQWDEEAAVREAAGSTLGTFSFSRCASHASTASLTVIFLGSGPSFPLARHRQPPMRFHSGTAPKADSPICLGALEKHESPGPTGVQGALLSVRSVPESFACARRPSTRCASGELAHIRIFNAIRVAPSDLEALIARRRGDRQRRRVVDHCERCKPE
jgi:hypothetical protein